MIEILETFVLDDCDWKVRIGKRIVEPIVIGSRGIYFTKKYVYKFSNHGCSQCNNEIEFWNYHLRKQDKKYFAKLLDWDKKEHKWVKQERIYARSGFVSKKTIHKLYDIIKYYVMEDCGVVFSAPYHAAMLYNCCIEKRSNQLKIFDYAL